jgi:serine/threonine protein phosphatase PrpC
MNGFIQNTLQTRIYEWLMRKTTNSGIRRVGELPLVIGSDIGIVRSENQDRVAVLRMQPDEGRSVVIAILCDGMGGMTEGAACASQAIARFFISCILNRHISPSERLIRAAQDANQDVNLLFNGMGGATLSAIMFDDHTETVGVNVGDSRIYSYQEKKGIEQLTIDDTMAGILKSDLQPKNELLQYIGMGSGLDPHVIRIPIAYESIILTSDGIHYIEKLVMQMVIQAAKDSAYVGRRLIEIAKWCGGYDNASVVVIRQFPLRLPLLYDPATIQIWDPFGELQIVLTQAENIARIYSKPPGEKLSIREFESQMSKLSAKQTKKEKPLKRGMTDKRGHRNKKKGIEKDQPRLQIYYNGDSGKDNG